MSTARVWNVTRGVELAGSARVADSHWTRLRGLLGRSEPGPGEGLLLLPCRGVHTWGMTYPLDVLLGDETGTVVAAYPSLRPWSRTGVHRDASWALEIPAGTLDTTGTRPGDEVRWSLEDERKATADGRRGYPGRVPK